MDPKGNIYFLGLITCYLLTVFSYERWFSPTPVTLMNMIKKRRPIASGQLVSFQLLSFYPIVQNLLYFHNSSFVHHNTDCEFPLDC